MPTPSADPVSSPEFNAPAPPQEGLSWERRFGTVGKHPFDEIRWTRRDVTIENQSGKAIFEQKDVEAPESWSDQAVKVTAQKYFRGSLGSPERETSVKQLISRVADTIAKWGQEGRYFDSDESAENFRLDLTHLLVNQMAAFNSPVWFNVGVEERPQCSACFINSVDDSMESILDLAKTEGSLFKYGSGTGTNFSKLRGSMEKLSSGGVASGPVSFMRGFDAFAGVIKSGGKTRRAAKMVILDADHPDIELFIDSKVVEEVKARALIDAGYDDSFNGEAYSSVFYQNGNHSVRVTDEFMQAVDEDADWILKSRTDGSTIRRVSARHLMQKIAEAAWFCGDPGIQFDGQIQEWNTCSSDDRINATNPCSEYVFLDDTACNLSSLNLLKFRKMGGYDVDALRNAIHLMTLAKEIIVGFASYPTEKIFKGSMNYRTLGLGYANLGALLMSMGVPYDSREANLIAGTITSFMCAEAYVMSGKIAQDQGPFPRFEENREPMLEVIEMHRQHHRNTLGGVHVAFDPLRQAGDISWDKALALGEDGGFRNAQVTVIAPTGTIAFLMDCATTGIEPELALVKYKLLAGEGDGILKMVNPLVSEALENLGYAPNEVQNIVAYIEDQGTIEGAPGLHAEHLPIFDCSFPPANGSRSIRPMGHVRMLAAVQPFVSGSISKTVNLPESATPEDIAVLYLEAWRLNLKCIAVYRDNCKQSQPLSTSLKKKAPRKEIQVVHEPRRESMPSTRKSLTHKFRIGAHAGYVTVGFFEDGRPGELFIKMAKEGSTVSGLLNGLARVLSVSLQYGIPASEFVKNLEYTRFEPSGFTGNKDIPSAKSILDYIVRWLDKEVLQKEEHRDVKPENVMALEVPEVPAEPQGVRAPQMIGPPCTTCDELTVPQGSCFICTNCSTTTGCG